MIKTSDYSQLLRKFLVEFLAEIFWSETRCGNKKADIILFDEFQNVTIKPGSALSSMLREGRKFVAGIIDLEQIRVWQNLLDKLQVGEPLP